MALPPDSPWLVAQYLTRRATADERRLVEAQVAADPVFAQTLVAMRDALGQAYGHPLDETNSAEHQADESGARVAAWEALQHAIQHTLPSPRRSLPRGVWPSRGGFSRWMTAGVIGVTVASVALVTIATLRGMLGTIGAPSRASLTASAHEYVTPVAQQATITLADGSHVRLAPQSRLHVATAFGDRTRTVWLQGEAAFDVHTARGAPFIVHTGGVSVRVVGTSFVVRRYAPDDTVQVAVMSGKVVAGNRRLVTLVAGTVGQMTDSTAVAASVTDLDTYTSWTRGRLVFDNAPVLRVLRTVGQWYGYEFRLTDSVLATRHVSATFDLHAPGETMATLKELLDVTMTFDGPQVTLHARRGPSALSTPSRRAAPDSLSHFTEVGR